MPKDHYIEELNAAKDAIEHAIIKISSFKTICHLGGKMDLYSKLNGFQTEMEEIEDYYENLKQEYREGRR